MILRQRYKKKTIKSLLLAGEGEREPPKKSQFEEEKQDTKSEVTVGNSILPNCTILVPKLLNGVFEKVSESH